MIQGYNIHLINKFSINSIYNLIQTAKKANNKLK